MIKTKRQANDTHNDLLVMIDELYDSFTHQDCDMLHEQIIVMVKDLRDYKHARMDDPKLLSANK